MDDLKTIFLTIFLTILVVVILNYGIIKRFSRKSNNEISYWMKTLDTAKHPWKKEDQDLDELSRLVKGIKMSPTEGKELEEENRQ